MSKERAMTTTSFRLRDLGLLVSFVTLLIGGGPMLASVTVLEPGAEAGNLNVSTMNSRSFLNKMTGAAQALEKYSFQFEISLDAKKNPDEHGNFYFMKPGFMRIEETGPYKHGAVA